MEDILKEETDRPLDGGSFFVGIGGISLGALAALAWENQERVGGFDHCENDMTRRLSQMGIPITYLEEDADMHTYDRVVYSLAIPHTNPYLQQAKQIGIPCESRPVYLGKWMQRYPKRIGVAGMHGKSTTTAMLAAIYLASDADPTILCGATLPFLGGLPYRRGKTEGTLLFEACEYRDAFLSFCPTTSVLLNLDLDHVDYFSSIAQIKRSMGEFAKKAEKTVANGEDPRLTQALQQAGVMPITFGLTAQNDYTATHVTQTAKATSFVLCCQGEELEQITLPLGGIHHLWDALAAAATAHTEGIALRAIAKGLANFQGANRRMESLGEWKGAAVYSDYAHHPTELTSALSLGRSLAEERGGRLLCVFQSHTYSRSAGLHQGFAKALTGADRLWILPIYAAREENTWGASPARLAVDTGGTFLSDPDILPKVLQKEICPKDLLLFCGAGDVDGYAKKLLQTE